VELSLGIELGVVAIDSCVEVSVEAVVIEIGFDRRTDRARAEDVASLEAADESDLLVWLDRDVGVIERESAGAAEVLIHVGAGLQAEVEAAAVNDRRRLDVILRNDSGLARKQRCGQRCGRDCRE